ncbi:MAG: hypothetical protein RIS47_547 [Bacteroidota bacterium]
MDYKQWFNSSASFNIHPANNLETVLLLRIPSGALSAPPDSSYCRLMAVGQRQCVSSKPTAWVWKVRHGLAQIGSLIAYGVAPAKGPMQLLKR